MSRTAQTKVQTDKPCALASETFDVEGMTCSACQNRVQKAVEAVPGTHDVSVNVLTNTMNVSFDGSSEMRTCIIDAVKKTGYKATSRQAAEQASEAQDASLQGTKAWQNEAANSTSTTAAAPNTIAPTTAAQRAFIKKKKQLIASLICSVPLFYLAMGPMFGWYMPPMLAILEGFAMQAVLQLCFATALMWINRSCFASGFSSLVQRAPTMDALIALGSAASYLYSLGMLAVAWQAYQRADMMQLMHAVHGLYFDSAGMILTFITLGKYFEARAKGRTTSALSSLLHLVPSTATVVRDGQELTIPVEKVVVGDTLIVKTGESLAVDGVLLEGEASIDESALTGEPLPVTKHPSDKLNAATLVQSGWLMMRAEAVGQDTVLAEIVRMVDAATMSKASMQRLADKIAAVFVQIVMTLALITFVAWYGFADPQNFSAALKHAVSVLVISCPCALGLAVPTALMVGTGRAARMGILIKNAQALETAGTIDTVVFDKTGTLTTGTPQVSKVVWLDDETSDESAAALSDGPAASPVQAETLAYIYALEQKSEHILARAIVNYIDESSNRAGSTPVNKSSETEKTVEQFAQIPGEGLEATVDGVRVCMGNQRLMNRLGLLHEDDPRQTALLQEAYAQMNTGATVLFCAIGDGLCGFMALQDTIKPDAAHAIAKLNAQGLHTMLLTGDQTKTAQHVMQTLGLLDMRAEVLPTQKQEVVAQLQQQNKHVAMVGDGINDAPALARADVGIALGAGTDIAMQSADIVLMHSSPTDVIKAIGLSHAITRTMKQNLFWAFIYNALCIPVAMGLFTPFGISLNPMMAALAMSFSSVFVVTNALRLYTCRIS